jgi:putative ABC transport system substrate-binding protein
VASLNRPGGNVTGVTGIAVALGQKRLGLLRDLFPDVAVVSFLLNPDSPNTAFDLPEMQAAAHALGLQLIVVNASSEHEINTAFVALAQRRAAALVVQAEPFLFSRREQIVALAARHGIPAIYVDRVFPVAGGLMSYGSDFRDVNRQAGIYAGRILNGEKPADLPVVQSIKYELVINLKTAKALGLDVPATLLALADEVIE